MYSKYDERCGSRDSSEAAEVIQVTESGGWDQDGSCGSHQILETF
jgi:hypothetical protein